MQDPFEQSLRELLREAPAERNDDDALNRVLKTANRRVGASELFTLMGRWGQALLIAVEQGSPNLAPRRRAGRATSTDNEAD